MSCVTVACWRVVLALCVCIFLCFFVELSCLVVWVCLCSNMRGIDAFHLNCVVTRCILFRIVLSLILVCNVVSRRSALLRGCHLLALRCALVWLVLLVLACSDFSLLCVLIAMFFYQGNSYLVVMGRGS